jgi:Protein of unknown function (DUF3800)
MPMKALYVFIDESGNFDFSASGTRYLVLSAVVCRKPIKSASRLLKLKYLRLALGFNTPGFHASQDRKSTKHQVLATISKDKTLMAFTVLLDKQLYVGSKVNPSDIYQAFGIKLAKYLNQVGAAKRVVLVFDKALKAREESSLFSSLKRELASLGGEYFIYFQNVSKDLNAQIADYIAWTNFVAFERGNRDWLTYLPHNLSYWESLEIET